MRFHKNGIKYFFRFILQIPSIYRSSNKAHIFLFATRRSGSTLLRNMIYSQPGFNYIDQPLDVLHFNPYIKCLPCTELNQYICLNESEHTKIRKYLDKLLSREFIIRSQWQLFNKNYHWTWDRYVLKILTANAEIEWFNCAYKNKIKIVYLTRHPIPAALSAVNLNWGLTVAAYLNNEKFIRKYLSKDCLDIALNIMRNGTELEKFVLNWCLENLVPLRNWKSNNWMTTVSYERIVSDPRYSVQRICQSLGLDDPDRMIEMVMKPSRTSTKISRKRILSNEPLKIISAWRKLVNASDLESVDRILKEFRLHLYSAHDLFPDENFDK